RKGINPCRFLSIKTGAFYAKDGVYAENAGAVFCQPLSAIAPGIALLPASMQSCHPSIQLVVSSVTGALIARKGQGL
ncbi:MAG: hypothetical protein JXA04_02290, partial [Gammaproteobacteria bacterium]|nr:hypothetical protein [Gammaproteobacteria bacterium]